jgi:hypothetical protein
MKTGAGSRYDYQLEEIFRKHGIGRALVLVHQPDTPVEKYEKLLIGDTTFEWEIVALEGLINTLEKLNEKGLIMTAKPPMPEPDPELKTEASNGG